MTSIFIKNINFFTFTSGYIAISNLSNIYFSNSINLKLTKLNDNCVKCGFPISALNKYLELLTSKNFKIQIVDSSNNQVFNFQDFAISESLNKILDEIKYLDINNLSVGKMYTFVESLQNKVKNLKERG